MTNERRKSPRAEHDERLSLRLGNQELAADLRNISGGGAYIRITEQDSNKITPADTGEIVTFRLAKDNAFTNYCGTINRYAEINDDKFLAVIFHETKIEGFV